MFGSLQHLKTVFLKPQHKRALALANDWRSAGKGKTFLFITHTWGGGIKRHVDDLITLVACAGGTIFLAQPSANKHIEIRRIGIDGDEVLVIDLAWGPKRCAEVLRALRIDKAHIHSLVGFSYEASDLFKEATADIGLHYDVTLHDYATICPRIHLINEDSMYCGEPDAAGCDACLTRNGSPFGSPAIVPWRARHERFLSSARAVFAPNEDVATRIRHYFKSLMVVSKPHIEFSRKPIRIVLIGSLDLHKGAGIVLATAKAAKRMRLPLEFIVLGRAACERELKAIGNVSVLGNYREQDVTERIAEIRPDLAWFASTWPETYSYTLSVALKAGLRCAAFNIGAIAQRIAEADSGILMPWEWHDDPDKIARALVASKGGPLADAEAVLKAYYDVE